MKPGTWRISRVHGSTRHYAAGVDVTGDVESISIEQREGLFYLLRYDSSGRCIADTAHLTIDEAIEQARFEYRLGPELETGEA